MELALLGLGALVIGFVLGGGSLNKPAPKPTPGPGPAPGPLPGVLPPQPGPTPGTLPDVSTFLVPGQLYIVNMLAPASLPSTGQPAIDNLAKAAADAGFAAALLPTTWMIQAGSATAIPGTAQGVAKATYIGNQITPISSAISGNLGVAPGIQLISVGPISQ